MTPSRSRIRGSGLAFALLALLSCKERAAPVSAASGLYRFGPAPRAEPKRIVSLAPNLTEILFALGAGPRVVGVTRFCDYPPEAKTRARVGDFLSVAVEAVAALRPELVVAVPTATNRSSLERLGELGIPILVGEAHTLADVHALVTALGAAVGRVADAARLVEDMRRRTAAVAARVAKASRPRVLFTYGRDPLIVAGPSTFAGELIELAGGVNLVREKDARYRSYSLERVLAEGPEVLVDSSMGTTGEALGAEGLRERWGRFPSLPAVRSGRLHWVDPQLFARPGPRLVDALEALCKLLHPELGARP